MEIDSTAPLSIHPDALPCLKRQQLENLCVRLGVKSTGKKSELIARLEGFATGHTNARKDEEEDEEEVEEDDVTNLPQSNSIRILSKPRESHFTSAKAVHDEELEEVGMVLPSSGSHGSVGSLRKKRSVVLEASVEVANEGDLKPSSSTRSNLYPWKKLLTSASSFRSVSSSLSSTTPMAPSAKLNEMGLGLHASDSQSSISSTMRKWLKGEGPSTVSGGDGGGGGGEGQSDRRRMTRSASAASVTITEMQPDLVVVEEQGSLSPRPKRKRSQESLAEAVLLSPTSTAEQPRRRIKPRPSRTARASIADEGQPNAIVQERILAEVRARMAAAKTDEVKSIVATTPTLPASPLKSVASRTRGRFSTQHEKNFDRMDSIATHYAAVRPAPASKEDGTSVKRARIASADSSKQSDTAPSSIRIADAVPANNVQRTAEEREAVRRKLEIARHRRRSSTATGRKSMSGGGGGGTAVKRMHHVGASGPGFKLAARHGFASKISGAVRGFMGAARGLTNTNADAAKKPVDVLMGPPPKVLTPPAAQATKPLSERAKKPSLTTTTTTATAAAAPSTIASMEARKKRSTFDLQASLARQPLGYVPYSAKETVGLLQSGEMGSSSIAFPLRKGSASRSPETSRTSDTSGNVSQSSSTTVASPTPTPPSSSTTPARHVAGRKTRSSTSTATRTSLQSPRKSNIATAAVSSTSGQRRRRQPSLQVAGQTMASTIIRQRRMQAYAVQEQQDQNASSPPPVADMKPHSKAHTTTVSVAGHGSPRKHANVVRIDGRGRGQSGLTSDRSQLTAINV